jgi:hypothetical protein
VIFSISQFSNSRKASTGSNRSHQSLKARSSVEEAKEVTEDLVTAEDHKNNEPSNKAKTDTGTEQTKSPNKTKNINMPRIK